MGCPKETIIKIVQRWSAKIQPVDLALFIQALEQLNELYEQYGRTKWGRLQHPLHAPFEIWMEREFPDVASLEQDESKRGNPGIHVAKKQLLEYVIPGTVELSYYEFVS